MTAVLDQRQDLSGKQLHQLLQLYTPPEFVKQASMPAVVGNPQLPLNCFADPVERLYPTHTSAATWVSAGFFGLHGNRLTEKRAAMIRPRLLASAAYYGILPQVETLLEKIASDKQAGAELLSDEDFALVIEYDTGHKDRRYPLRNAMETKRAAAYLQEHADEFRFQERHTIATRILDKAAAYGANLGEHQAFLEKQAGYGTCSIESAMQVVWDRVVRMGHMSHPTDAQVQLAKVAKALGTSDPWQGLGDPRLIKLASLVSDIDREYHFDRLYGTLLRRPEEIFFEMEPAMLTKLAGELVETRTGYVYNLADLDRIRLTELQNALGSDIAQAVSMGGTGVSLEKLAAVIPTLPLPDAREFDQIAKRCGVQPLGQERPLENASRLDQDELFQLAALG